MADGETRSVIGTLGFIACLIGFFALMSETAGDRELGGCCCWGIIFVAIGSSGHDAQTKAKQRKVIVYQQPSQQIIHHTHHNYIPQQTPVVQRQPVASAQNVPRPSQLERQPIDVEKWIAKARNLEMARDWEGAAQAYQKAGLYHEAGRIRQTHLEKDDSSVKIHVDRIGDTIQDSVVMKDSDSQEDSES